MKSIFLGGSQMFNVFDKEARGALVKEAGIFEKLLSKNDIIASPADFTDTECIFSTWGMPSFTSEEIKKYLPSLKAIFYGAGTVQHFARPFIESGIKVFSAWGANAVPVAEYTVAQIILANKGFFTSARMTTSPEGRAAARKYIDTMHGNYGATVGIIGAGMIGKLVINMLKPYNLKVVVYDPFLSDEKAAELGVKKVSLEELFLVSSVISNHVAHLPETVGLINYSHFSLMKDNATFINTGRGAQVVEEDMIRMLEEKPFVTAILDVTLPEPPIEGSKLYTLKNVYLTPHIAGSFGDELARMGQYMVNEYRKYKSGVPCQYEVSLKMLETMA